LGIYEVAVEFYEGVELAILWSVIEHPVEENNPE
jgi:hypothetical protein